MLLNENILNGGTAVLYSDKGKEKNKQKKAAETADIWDDFSNTSEEFDVLGSYTGNPVGEMHPVQDADDL